MEFVGLTLGVGGVTAKVSSKLWELTKRWQDAPREIFALRDSVMRAENFFVEVARVIKASTTDTVTEPWTQYEQISVLLRHGEATLREVDTIIDQVQEVVPSISDMVIKGLRTPGGDVKLKKVTWLKKRARVTAIQKQLKDIMLHICGLLLSLNTSMSVDIHSSVGHLHETQLARGGDPFSPFHESLTNRIEQTLTTHIDQRLEQIVMDIVKRVAPVPAHTPISPWTPFIHGTTKCVQTSFRCDSDCGCQCHSPRGYGAWTLSALKSVAGTVKLSFTGFNLRGNACDRHYCKSGRSGHQRVCLSYILPPWLLNKVIFLIYNDITGSPEMLLRIVRVVSPEYLSVSDSIFGSVRSESVEGLKVVLKNKKGSIYDILFGFLYTPLGFAIAYGYIDSARILLRAGSDPFQQHGIVEAPIRAAFRIFLNGTEPYATDYAELFDFGDLLEEDDYSELQRVILGLMPSNLDQLLSTPRTASTLNHVNYSGQTALHLAALKGEADVTRRLVRAGMDVDAKDKIGKSPLHLACQTGDYDTVRALVEAGAFINAKGLDGETPLFIAAKRADSVALISYLVRHGADINCVDRHGTAAASPCILSGCVASLAYVLDHVANINTRDNDGDSLVVDAIVWNKPACVRLLIQRGVDYRGANKYGGTPFHMLATYGQVEVIQALAQMHLADVDITAKDNAGLTPLQVMEKRQNCAPDIREAFYKLLDSMERSYCGDQLTASTSVDVQDCGLSDDEMFFDCAEGP